LAPDGLVCLGILYLLLCQEILDVTSATLRQAEEKEEEFAWSDSLQPDVWLRVLLVLRAEGESLRAELCSY